MSMPTDFPVSQDQAQGRCIAVFAPQHGALRTTTAVNLACGLASAATAVEHLPVTAGADLRFAEASGPDSTDRSEQGQGERLPVVFEDKPDDVRTVLVDFVQPFGKAHSRLGYTDKPGDSGKTRQRLDRDLSALLVCLLAEERCTPTPESGLDQATLTTLLAQYVYPWTHHPSVGQRLHLLPGLLSADVNWTVLWAQRQADLLQTARTLLQTLKRMYRYVVVDAGHDYCHTLTAAALAEATDVILPLPALRTATVSAQRALPVLVNRYSAAFRWLPVTWRGDRLEPGMSAVDEALGIPRHNLGIPHNPRLARQAEEECLPYGLWDDSPAGLNMRRLADHYLRANQES